MIGSGELSDVVRIERLVEKEDSDANREASWQFQDEVPARIDQLRGNERQEAGNARGFQTHRVTLRFYGELTTKDRLVQRIGPDEGPLDVVHNLDSVVHDYMGDSTVALTVAAS